MICRWLQVQLQYVKMATSDKTVFHLVDIQALGKSVNTSVIVPSPNVITSMDVEIWQVYGLVKNENSITLKTIKRIQFPWIYFIHAFLFKTLIFYNRIWFKFIFCKDQTYFPLAFKNNIYSTFFSWIAMSCGLIIFMIFPSRKW